MAVSYDELDRQASMAVDGYLNRCIRILDDALGRHYRNNYPDAFARILASMVSACAQEYSTGCMNKVIEEHIEPTIRGLADEIGGLRDGS